MATTSDSGRSRRGPRRSDSRVLARFVEELSWLLTSYEELDFRALSQLSKEFISISRASSDLLAHSQRPPVVRLLVGVLPSFLIDSTLFPANEDIVEFAHTGLGITIPRWRKKSRYELIGHIVCHTNQAPQLNLDRVMMVLEHAFDEKSTTRRKMAQERKSGRSWNEVIQALVRDPE